MSLTRVRLSTRAILIILTIISPVKFEIEVCILADNLRGIRLKRLQGDTWIYKSLCKAILDELHI